MDKLIGNIIKEASVYYRGVLAGTLTKLDTGFSFQYDSRYLISGTPIAFCYPLQKEPFLNAQLPAFFDNLVSEGWMRKLQSITQKIDENDRFGLLIKNGRDLVGAVTVLPYQK
ncbi:HipA N-terminal domain-containing protein [Pelagibaculum spongiae]|uniref:HipA N-terminal subdomain 1 domain-containing protein n=1 Tax=Pelagibaculum spongiae TaxID=2080658 RepID=A0A2V1GZY1_9GAMM|nr:HipA N-terminal domain-containing protein [Pelagibaculum spongiae]PVZ70504.1 hypothetical protein DC094_07945 [Pelagibaculum spongiae]